jgi:hypothetical protein
MASQTKSEPVDRTPPELPTNLAGASSRVDDSEVTTSDVAPPSGALASGQGSAGDDEDVSLDELMMSDSNDGEDERAASSEVGSSDASAADPEGAAEPPGDAAPESSIESAPYSVELVEDDEASALAAAAAAQEAAASAAAAEADARVFAARRGSEPPLSAPRHGAEPPGSPQVASIDAEPAALDAGAVGVAPDSAAADDHDGPLASEPEALAPMPVAAFAAGPEASVELEQAFASVDPSPAPPQKPPSTPPPAGARRDAPLPSFEIPEVESTRARRGPPGSDDDASSRVNARPLASPLQLSEVGEDDDDDAVTHIGLPVVPESPSDYAHAPGGFQAVDPGVAALQGFEPELSLSDARRATTRMVPRIDPVQLEQRRARVDTNPALTADRHRPSGGVGEWLSSVFKRSQSERAHRALLPAARRRSAWLLDTVLPSLSLVLFGSGIGAGIMLLQPDRGARAAQQAQTVQALKEGPAAKVPTTLADRAEAGDGDALFKITNMSPNERSSELTLALERGYQAQKQNEFREFARQLEAPSGLSTPNLAARFLNFATSPETMLPAFAHLLGWPGSTGPDVLYAVWEKAPGGNRAASLAQQLLHSADQRAKATPALVTAIDLRSATSCEDYLRVLPAVQRDGDQRSSATLRALKHTDGCGDDGQKDCFACLREGRALDEALKAIEGRAAPQL